MKRKKIVRMYPGLGSIFNNYIGLKKHGNRIFIQSSLISKALRIEICDNQAVRNKDKQVRLILKKLLYSSGIEPRHSPRSNWYEVSSQNQCSNEAHFDIELTCINALIKSHHHDLNF
jgi:hypothetical protein